MPVPSAPLGFDHSIEIAATVDKVFDAFFDPHALASWWQAARSVTVARPLGIYAVEWKTTTFEDEILGPLGGVFHGTVMDASPPTGFFLAEAYWIPPQGDPIGPMAFEVALSASGPKTRVRIKQTGYEEGPRWRRYYEIVAEGWKVALADLKTYAEQDLASRLWGKWGRITAAEREASEGSDAESASPAVSADPHRAKDGV